MKNKCELCKMEATTFCESDEAALCWNCDAKVHCANFLVARHTRFLLCRICRRPTPWSASGPSLPRSLCICHGCARIPLLNTHQPGDKEGEGENQVVPLSSHSPPACSSSLSTTSEEYETGVCGEEAEAVQRPSVKRARRSCHNLRSSLTVQEEKEWRCRSGTAEKRVRGRRKREECDGESWDSVSRTI